LVSGHLEPDDALRVREYLGRSEICRAAYRELDSLDRGIARLGPGAAESHPEPEEWAAYADGAPIEANRKDVLAEHARLCAGCAAVAEGMRATAARHQRSDLWQTLDAPSNRKKIAVALALLTFALPLGAYELSRGRAAIFDFVGGAGVDLGEPLRVQPDRAPAAVAAGSLMSVRVPVEPGVVYDLRFESAAGSEIASVGQAPVRDLGAGNGIITFALKGAGISAGEYRLHLLRRVRAAGGEPMDWVYPISVR
jgi:hypothetical protein